MTRLGAKPVLVILSNQVCLQRYSIAKNKLILKVHPQLFGDEV